MYDKIYYPYPATDNKHKFFIITANGHKVNFGSAKNKDYTIYCREYGKEIADKKKHAYIARHSKLNEKWGIDGINSAGFFSKWLLWNKPTIEESYQDIQQRFLRHL